MPDETVPPSLPEPPVSSGNSTGLPENIAATIACALPFVGGVLFLVLERSNPFVRFYSMQSVIFGVATLIVSFALQITVGIFKHVPLIGSIMLVFLLLLQFLFGLAWLVIWITTMMKAFRRVEWEIPYIGPIARHQVVKDRSV